MGMGDTKLVQGSMGLFYGFALTGAAAHLAGKASLAFAKAVVNVQPDMPVEMLTVGAVPLAAYFAHTALSQRIDSSQTSFPHIRNKIWPGSAAALATVAYLAVFHTDLFSYDRTVPIEQSTITMTNPVIPPPPTGGIYP